MKLENFTESKIYIKTYETKITQKSLIEAIDAFLKKALPDNFKIKVL